MTEIVLTALLVLYHLPIWIAQSVLEDLRGESP